MANKVDKAPTFGKVKPPTRDNGKLINLMAEACTRLKAGDNYDGTWKNGMMDGEGVLYTAQGERYKGQFKDNQKHGSCIEITADGTRFEGSYDRGERHGNFTEYDKKRQ